MKKTYQISIIVVLIIFLSSVSITGADPQLNQTTDAYMYEEDFSNITIDGINDNEYPILKDIATTGGNKFAEIGWAHNQTHIAVFIKSLGTGWVGLGLDNSLSPSMDSADIIMINIIGGVTTAYDMNVDGYNSPVEDADSYIDDQFVDGIEENGETHVELIIPMSSSDIAGDDHDWSVGNQYGFFLAYHSTNDDLTTSHTAHSPAALIVEIIDGPFQAMELNINVDVDYLEEDNIVNMTVVVYQNNTLQPVEGLELQIYRKTQFGKSFINTTVTDSNGEARTNITVNYFQGDITFIVSFLGSTTVVAAESSSSVNIIAEHQIGLIEEEHLDDLRGIFGEEHLMRTVLLYSFYATIGFILALYLSVVRDIFRIKSASSKNNKEDSE